MMALRLMAIANLFTSLILAMYGSLACFFSFTVFMVLLKADELWVNRRDPFDTNWEPKEYNDDERD